MTDLATTNNLIDFERLGSILHASGMFPDSKDEAQCAAKLVIGHGLGLTPYDSMTLHIIQGKINLGANIMAAAIKRSAKYDYKAQCTNEEAVITFYNMQERDAEGRPTVIGTSVFTMDDAIRAGIASGMNWKKYPQDMLFARAISRGYRQNCPDALGDTSAPVYVESHGETEIPRELPEAKQFAIPQDDERMMWLENNITLEERGTILERAGVKWLDDLNEDQLEASIKWIKSKQQK